MNFGSSPSPKQVPGQQVTGEFQTDVPHALSFANHKGWDLCEVEDSEFCSDSESKLCDADHYIRPLYETINIWSPREKCKAMAEMSSDPYMAYPEYRDAFIEEICIPRDSFKVESLALCERPYFFSSGSHRAAMVVTQGGDMFVLAIEEAPGYYTENLFIQALSNEGYERLDRELALQLLDSAMLYMGVPMTPDKHKIWISFYGRPYMNWFGKEIYMPTLLYDACVDSEWIDNL